jgi:hypothetical protein
VSHEADSAVCTHKPVVTNLRQKRAQHKRSYMDAGIGTSKIIKRMALSAPTRLS